MENENFSQANNGLKYISFIGSAISSICFFAPWLGCAGATISGADMGKEIWLIFATSTISLLSFLFFNSIKTLSKAKFIVLISSIIGLGFLVYNYVKLQSGTLHDGVEIKWGAIATCVGFIVSIMGVSYLNDERTAIAFVPNGSKTSSVNIPYLVNKYRKKISDLLNPNRKIPGKWYFILNKKPTGPIDGYQIMKLIKDGIVAHNTKVWTKGMKDWKAAEETVLIMYLPINLSPIQKDILYCVKCGTALSPNAIYCAKCGSKVNGVNLFISR